MALSGALGGNGRAALIAIEMWRDSVNAKGGLLGRPVKLIYYDDQTNPALVPGIYSKLLDVDKVDLMLGGYGTALQAAALPIVMQHKMVLIGTGAVAANEQFKYDECLEMYQRAQFARFDIGRLFPSRDDDGTQAKDRRDDRCPARVLP